LLRDERAAMRVFVVAATVMTAACAAPPAESPRPPGNAASAPAADVGPYRFGWGAPCRVPVRESTEKKGKTARMSYFVDVRRRADGNLEVRLDDFAFLALDGNDVSGSHWRERLAPALTLASTIPVFQVSPKGEYVGAEGIEEAIERVLSARALPAEQAEQMRQMLTSPLMAAALEEKVGDTWRTWVESWIDWSVAPGQSKSENGAIQLATGAEVPIVLRLEHLGFRDGHAHLRATNVLSGDAFLQALKPFLENIEKSVGNNEPILEAIGEGRRETILEVETVPATLRPRRTRAETRTEITMKNGTVSRQREIREIEWDWARAQGCSKS
jgi:hypothetical protein